MHLVTFTDTYDTIESRWNIDAPLSILSFSVVKLHNWKNQSAGKEDIDKMQNVELIIPRAQLYSRAV